MWARPDGHRILVAATEEGAAYVSGVDSFDKVVVGPLDVRLGGRRLDLRADGLGLKLHLRAGRGIVVAWPRPAWSPAGSRAPSPGASSASAPTG